MQLSIKGKQLDIGDSLRGYIEENLATAVGKYFENPVDAHVVMSKQGHSFQADIQVHINRRILVQGHGAADDAHAAFDMANAHVTKRLRRYKRRLLDDQRRKGDRDEVVLAQQYVLAPEPDVDGDEVESDEADQPVIVAELTTAIETMSVSHAVMRMDLAGQPAFMFRNSAHGGLNMVYVRGDGNIGWVDPQGDTGTVSE